jgi:hypothetical protein
MIFQRRSRPKFSVAAKYIEYCKHYNYLGLKINSTGHLNEAMSELREKACRAFYTIKKPQIEMIIPIQIWLKLFECVIEPIATYGSEMWGPLAKQDITQWGKQLTNNACRAELGQYPLIIKTQ